MPTHGPHPPRGRQHRGPRKAQPALPAAPGPGPATPAHGSAQLKRPAAGGSAGPPRPSPRLLSHTKSGPRGPQRPPPTHPPGALPSAAAALRGLTRRFCVGTETPAPHRRFDPAPPQPTALLPTPPQARQPFPRPRRLIVGPGGAAPRPMGASTGRAGARPFPLLLSSLLSSLLPSSGGGPAVP